MAKTHKDLLIIFIATIFSTLLIWLPHLLSLSNFYGLNFKEGFNTIYRNYDGIEYIIIAKTLYIPHLFTSLPQELPATYFASHFPLYSLLILAVSLQLGFLKSMLLVSILFTIFSAFTFYFLVKDFKLTDHPLTLSLVFLILPARWLIVRSVGSSEPVFIFFALTAFYFFLRYEQKRNIWDIYLVGISGLLAQLTRPPGILIFIALSLYIIWRIFKDKHKNFLARLFDSIVHYHPLILIPAALIAIFYWYSITYTDFLAYFHSGDNIHLTFPPFQVFNKDQFWVGDIWLEDIVYIYLFGLLGGLLLIKQKLYPLAFFVLTYVVASLFVAHRDISRYILPTFPFILIAFEKILTTKEFKIVLGILLLGIYLYAQNYILANTAPYANLELFN